VEWKSLGEVADYVRGLTYNKSNESGNNTGYKIIRANNITLSRHTLNFDDVKYIKSDTKVKESQKLFKNDILISAASGSREHVGKVAFVFSDLDYFFGGFMAVVRCSKQIEPRFMFHILTSSLFQKYLDEMLNSSTINNLSSSVMNGFSIPIPSLSIQKEIVRILDTFTALTTELGTALSTELTARKQQYNFYREQLFSFNEGEVEWNMLGEVVTLQRGRRLVRSQLEETGKYAVYQNAMTPLGYYHESNVKAYTTFVICAGAAGEIGFSYADYWAADDVFSCLTPKNINNRYLYFYLLTQNHKIFSQVRRASIPRLSKDVLAKIQIPIPSLKKQERIVSILDKFDTLTTSISESLPKEMALRKQQYEYYRDKLLTFKKSEL
jgi:type I restriction enzyme S subunit